MLCLCVVKGRPFISANLICVSASGSLVGVSGGDM